MYKPLNKCLSIGRRIRHTSNTLQFLNCGGPKSAFSTVVPFKLADIGEGIAEVELMKWFVKEGDVVKSFDRICEVQSDKATVEITSRYDGIIGKIIHEEGAIVKVGDSLLDILVKGASETHADISVKPSDLKSKDQRSVSGSASLPVASTSFEKVLTTPAVRKMAKENKVDLSSVPPTGPKGRITKEDLQIYLGKKSDSNTSTPPSPVTAAENTDHPVHSTAVNTIVPIRGVQRLMVKSMTAANAVPHLTLCEEVTFDNLKTLKNELGVSLGKKGVKLSYMPFMIKAASLALTHFPMLNATVNSDATEMTYHGNHNFGIAMDTPKGLIVPVIKGVQNLSLIDIAKELAVLQDCAAKGTIKEAQLSGGTFSLSNIGSIGGTYAVPVIVVPQVVIGALGRLQTLPRYINKQGRSATSSEIESGAASVMPSTIMNVSWSADHRVADGATVARFSNLWKNYLENPGVMLAELK